MKVRAILVKKQVPSSTHGVTENDYWYKGRRDQLATQFLNVYAFWPQNSTCKNL